MARLPRFDIPGQPQHVIQRGNNRAAVFASEDDCLYYLDKLAGAADKHDCELHAYVLMTNHVHLLITPRSRDAIGRAVQQLGRHYVRYFNDRYRRTGTLWEGRFKSVPIDTESYLLLCMRYIELNPVRAAMVARPSEYRWSSYRANAEGQCDSLLTAHPVYERLGKGASERHAAYRALFEPALPGAEIQALRDATNKGWPFGDEEFRRRMEQESGRRANPLPRGGDRRSEAYREETRAERS